MFDEQVIDLFDFADLKSEYNSVLKKWNIIQGTVLKSKLYFTSWAADPLAPDSFESGSIFTIVDIISRDGEHVLHCFQNDKIIEIDSLVLFLNSTHLHMDDKSVEETFSTYFEKIL